MKKVILAFDGSNFSDGAFEFARRLHELQPIFLAGIFLPQTSYANLWSYADVSSGSTFIPMLENDSSESVKRNIERFKALCEDSNIKYHVHNDRFDFALPELKGETRFADLLILSSEKFFESFGNDAPNLYLKDVLHEAECPVLIVPERFDFPESNILAYDGSESSVYAIKQFVYLFPEFCDNKTLLVYSSDDPDKEVPNKANIQELAARHFNASMVFKLPLDPKKYFATWVVENKAPLLVSGSFARSGFSQLFKKSFVEEIIREHKTPIFIAHS